jgi:hypothetical protein
MWADTVEVMRDQYIDSGDNIVMRVGYIADRAKAKRLAARMLVGGLLAAASLLGICTSAALAANAAVSGSADVSVALTGPGTAADGTTITEALTVANAGPGRATCVISAMTIPAGLSVTNAGGATRLPGTLSWVDNSINAGAQVTHTVTFTVTPGARGNAVLGASAASSQVKDPNYSNNVTATTIALGTSEAGLRRSRLRPVLSRLGQR